MRTLLQRFSEVLNGSRTPSKDDAKQRLKFLLIHDQVDLTPAQLDKLKSEIMDVIARYVDIDTDSAEFRLNREDGEVALVSSIPVRRVTARA
jgi:cell division topological specificity factor